MQITITADTLSSLNDRVATIIGENYQFNLSASTVITQKGYQPRTEYLTFDIISGGTILWKKSGITKNISYSKDNGLNWTEIRPTTEGTAISVNAGDKVLFKGDNSGYSGGVGYSDDFCSFGSVNAKFNVKGNIMSLIDSTGFATANTFSSTYTFTKLFKDCTGLISAENLALPVSELYGADGCYNGMFYGCTSLTTAPPLPATGLTDICYGAMFFGCTSLTTAPALPATRLALACYDGMFYGCSSLTSAPELPATTLAEECYYFMFQYCTSLTTAPALPATTLARGCYHGMFWGCSSLTTAPELPVTTLAEACYMEMFSRCTSLTTAPELPATTLADYCYESMFRGCTSLNYIKCLATDMYITATDCTIWWVSGVSATGTFVKNASESNWTTGEDGIPTGWVVINDDGSPIVTGISISNLNWTTNVPASGGTATSANCSFNVIAYYSDSTTGDVTSQSTISGSQIVPSSQITSAHTAGTLTLSASYSGLSANSSVIIYQDAYIPAVVTGISLNNITWTTNVPASGGTADSGNCSYTVTAYYNNGTTSDITSIATVSGSQNVPSSQITSAHTAGTLTLTASYSGFTDSDSIAIIQDAYSPVPPTPTGSSEYLTLTIVSGGTINWLKQNSNYSDAIIYYSINDGNWTSIVNTTTGTSFNVSSGDVVRIKGEWGNNYIIGKSFSGSTAYFNVSCNILSLYYGDDFSGQTSLPTWYDLSGLFKSTNVINAGGLILPSMLSDNCYSQMFWNCTSLVTAPELPATTLSSGCYFRMFEGCTSLTTAPELPATSLVQQCYQQMFYGCTSLNYIKCLATSISGYNCTYYWLGDVSATGTFVKNPNMSSWTTGYNGIPSGWTVQDAT